MVENCFHLASKWPNWCAQTLYPFSQILKFFSGISARIVAPSNGVFQTCPLRWKGHFFRENKVQTASKSAYKINVDENQISLLTETVVCSGDTVTNEQKSEKHQSSSSHVVHADVHRSISTKLTMIKDLRAVIAPP